MALKYFEYFLFTLSTGVCFHLNAQVPQIQKIEPASTFPNNRILISGTGFSSAPAQLQVWFDQVKGTIVASSATAIEVDVPAQARLQNIEVINLLSGLSAKSFLKFTPSFSGDLFDPAKFTIPLSITSTTELWDICSCDFNIDGKPDLVSTKFFSPSSTLMILQNQSVPGTVAFSKTDLAITFPTDNAVCGDLDGDGKPELVVSRSGAPRNSIHIFRNISGGSVSFTAPINLFLDVGHFATRMVMRDLNRDGKSDLIVSNSFNNILYIFQNTSSSGALSFNTTPIKIAIPGTSTNYGVEVQDLDGDRLPDIAFTPFQANDIFILPNQSTGTIVFGAAQKISLSGTLNGINSADFNQDNKLDLVVTNTINNQVHVLLNQSSAGSFSFGTPINLASSNGPWGVDIADIDGDSDPDLIVANRNQATLNIFLHAGNFSSPSFTKVDIATSKTSRNVKAGDLDGDGKPDLAITTFNAALSAYTLDIVRNTNCHQPKILNEQPLVICSGQTIRLKTIPANQVTFIWKKGSTTIKNSTDAFVDITDADTYTVTATGEGGACAILSDPIVVSSSSGTIPSDPTINSNAPLCTGSSLNLSTAAVAGGTYAWSGPNNFTSAQQNPTIMDVGIQQAGLYTLQISVGLCKSNVVSSRIDVVNLDELSISSNVPSNTVCQGGSVLLSVPADPAVSYQWIKNGTDIVGQVANTLSVNQAGSYSVRAFNASVSCTKTAGPVNIVVVAPPVAAFQIPAQACMGEEVAFTNQATTDPLATPVYNWNFGDTKNSVAASPTHSYSTAQAFSPSLSVSYAGITGCSANNNKNIIITNSTAPVIVATAEEICLETEVTTLSISGTYTSISWSSGGSGHAVTINQPGNVVVNTIDANGCKGKDEMVISAKPVPTIEVTASKNRILPGEFVQLEATGADTYAWSPNETLNSATIADPLATPLLTTIYTVIGTLNGGCSSENTITITTDESAILIKPLPAFSPNGDGSNEVWTIEGVEGYPDCVMAVFDGRGRRVYERKGYNSDWNGTYQERPVPDGTYFFVFGCPDRKPVTGSVLIFR